MRRMRRMYGWGVSKNLISGGLMLIAVVLAGCAGETGSSSETEATSSNEPALKDVFAGSFLVGTAINTAHVTGRSPLEVEIAKKHFNAITPENATKWERIHPEPGRYDFDIADRIVEFGEANEMTVIGHTLVWHSQTPDWVFEDDEGNPVSRDTLLARMKDHISTVVGRYRGRITGWDVVNEALNDDGTLRDTPYRRIVGDDYVAKAFEFAHEADPDAELYYNDYSLPNPSKRDGAVALVKSVQDLGIPVSGIGMQGHYQIAWPTPENLNAAIEAFAGLGIDVMITELDINVLPQVTTGAEISDTTAWRAEIDPFTDGLPEEMSAAQARKYGELFRAFLEHDEAVTRVTFWGVSDASSWKNNWPVPGRTNHPLIFDRNGNPKAAFHAIVEAAQ